MATQAELELVISMRDRAASQLRGLQTQMTGLTRTVQQMSRAFSGAGSIFGGAGLTAITGSIAGIGLAFDSTEEQARLAFEQILGSGDKANDMIERVKKTALATPFAFTDLLRSSQRLLAAGFDPDQVDKQLMTISDTISSTGDISRDKLDMMTGAFARMRMSGVFSMEAIQELGSSGVNVIHLLAEQAGTTDFAMTRMLEHMSGRMPAGPMMERIFGVLQAKYGGLAAKQADTMQGVLNNIKDLLQQRLGAIMLPIFVRTEALLRRIFYYLDQVREEFKLLPAPVKEAAKWLAAALLVLTPIALAVQVLGPLITTLVAAFGVIAGVVGPALLILEPFAPLIALIAIAAFTLYEAWTNNWFGIQDITYRVVGYLSDLLSWFGGVVSTVLADPIGAVVALFRWLADTAGAVLAAAWQYVVDLATWVGNAVLAILRFALDGWLKVFGLNTDDIMTVVYDAVGYVQMLWQWLADTVGPIVTGLAQTIGWAFDWAREAGGNAIQWVTQRVVDLFVWMRDTILAVVVPLWTAVVAVFEWVRDTGAGAVEWLVARVVQLFTWMRDVVRGIWDPISGFIGGVVNVGGGGRTQSNTSSLVATGVGGANGGGGSTNVVNINGPVYADDIEDQVVRALDAARRKGRTG